jgi:chromosome segregation ATPase
VTGAGTHPPSSHGHGELQALQQAHKSLQDDFASLQRHNEEVQRDYDALKELNDILQEDTNTYQSDIWDQSGQLKTQVKTIQDQRREISKLESINTRLQHEAEQLEKGRSGGVDEKVKQIKKFIKKEKDFRP